MKNLNLNILIVEDEVISTHYLLAILESFGIEHIYDATNMEDAVEIVKNNHIDIAFMDINIQGSTDGIITAKIINRFYTIPIIFTTAYTDSHTIQEATETNSFGYIIKPFQEKEVEVSLAITLKRIQTLQNSINPRDTNELEIINFSSQEKYNLTNKTFYVNNKPIPLTKIELDVLYIFCQNLNRNITYNTLKEKVWNNKDIAYSTIRDTISRLKKKIPTLNIENIVNYGYILKK